MVEEVCSSLWTSLARHGIIRERDPPDSISHAEIIFVTASRNKATIYKKSLTHQWFDNWHLQDVTKRQDMMSDGLKKSCDYIHRVLEKEIVTIGKENFVLWGMSQGCATSLSALLSWDGQPFAATVGMCGWLPYSNMLIDIGGGRYSLNTSDLDDDLFGQDDDSFGTGDSFEQDDDPFVTSDDDNDDNDDNDIISLPKAKKYKAMEAVEYLSKEIQMEDKMGSAFKHVPIFLGHGVEDDRVSIDLGREAKTCLDLIGADAKMIEYEGLGHWYSADMLRDIFEFLKGNLGEE